MMQRRRLIILLMAGLFVSLITSLGVAKTLSKQEIVGEAKNFAGITLNVSMSGADVGFMQEVVSEFEQSTGINVEMMAVPDSQMYEKLMIGFMTGTAPYDSFDFMHRHKGGVAAFALDLGELNAKYGFNVSDVLPVFRPLLYYPTDAGPKTDNPRIIGFPSDGDFHVFFWRKDYFEKVGLDPNIPPADIDQLMEYAKKLNEKDLDGNGRIDYGFGPRMSRWGAHIGYSTVMNAFGIDWFCKDWKPAINSEEGIKTLEWWLSTRKYSVPNYQELSWPTMYEAFNRGDFAMMWNFTSTKQIPDLGPSVCGMSLPPRGPFGLPHNMTSGASLFAVTKQSKHPEAAYLFLRFLTCPEIHKKITLSGDGDIGVCYRYTLYDPEFQAEYMYPGGWKLVQKVCQLTQELVPAQPLCIPETKALHQEMDLQLSEAYSDQLTAKEALDKMAKTWTDIMVKGGYYNPGAPSYNPAYRKPAPDGIYLK